MCLSSRGSSRSTSPSPVRPHPWTGGPAPSRCSSTTTTYGATAAPPPVAEPTKFSMADAGRLALASEALPGSRSRDEILLGAAQLWCRDLSVATVRAIGGHVGRAAVTVLRPFGSAIQLHAQVIRREWDLLRSEWYEPSDERAWAFLHDHARRLAEVDRVLLRLPALVHAAVSGPTLDGPAGATAERTPPLYLLAAQAATATRWQDAVALVRAGGWGRVPSAVATVA